MTVTPDPAEVVVGGSVQFAANVTGTADSRVVWSLQEGLAAGQISSTGLYLAPSSFGTYHVIATSSAQPTAFATVTVQVDPPPMAPTVHAPSQVTAFSVGNVAYVQARPGMSYVWSIDGGNLDLDGGATSDGGTDVAAFSAGDVGSLSIACDEVNGVGARAGGAAVVQVIPAPTISSLDIVDGGQSIFLGQSSTLVPTFSDGSGVIDHGVGAVVSGAQYVVSPQATTTYQLTVTNGAGTSVSSTATVSVDSAPVVITSFTASPAQGNFGDQVQLSWALAGDPTSLVLSLIDGSNPQDVLGSNSVMLYPVRRQTYQLDGANPVGGDRKQVTVAMRGLDQVAGPIGGTGTADDQGADARFNNPGGVVKDAAGNFFVADTGNNTIRKVTPQWVVTTFAGQPGVSGTANGAGSAAQFNQPRGMAIDGSGNIYVCDSGNNKIRLIDSQGNVSDYAGDGTVGSTNSTRLTSKFSNPTGITFGFGGALYVVDKGNHAVRKIDTSGNVTTFAGTVGTSGSTDGAVGTGKLNSPTGIAYYSSSPYGMWVTDSGNCTVRQVLSNGNLQLAFGATGQCGTADGVIPNVRLGHVEGIVRSSQQGGSLYLADPGNAVIRWIWSTGETHTVTGLAGQTGSTDGDSTVATLEAPHSLVEDPANQKVVIADKYGVRSYDRSTGVLTTVAGRAPSFQPALDVELYPPGIAATQAGNIYVSSATEDIQQVFSDGGVAVVAGGYYQYGYVDGPGASAKFKTPQGLAFDDSRQCLYIADSDNNIIRRMDADGGVTTFSGDPAAVCAWLDGDAGSARFCYPSDVAVDSAGTVYVADTLNQLIRKLTPSGAASTFAGFYHSVGYAPDKFTRPVGIAVDHTTGNVIVADSTDQVIRIITPGGSVSLLAGVPRSIGNADGAATTAQFNTPTKVGVDPAGNVYVLDSGNALIRKITPQGVVSTVAGRRSGGLGVKLGLLPGGLNTIFGMGVTPQGDILVGSEGGLLQVTAP